VVTIFVNQVANVLLARNVQKGRVMQQHVQGVIIALMIVVSLLDPVEQDITALRVQLWNSLSMF
jgi:hypothetical protein